MPNPNLRGRFVWHELMTSDVKAAAKFYGGVVGWKTEAMPQNPSYTMFMAPGGAVAGVMPLPEDAKAMGMPPSWMTYVGTPDIDRTLRQLRDMGGRVHKDVTEVPNVGRFAIVQDPVGASFALFTSEDGPMGDDMPKLGEFSWHELATTDLDVALEFYQALFGWEKGEAMEMGPGMTYQMFGWKNRPIGGMYRKPAEMPGPPSWLPYILVSDATHAVATTKNRNGQVLNGPMEVPGGDWVAQGLDPQGAMFAVHASAQAAAAPAERPAAKKAAAKKTTAPAKAAPRGAAKKAGKKTAAGGGRKVAKRKVTAKTTAKKAGKKKAARKAVTKKTATKKATKKTATKKGIRKAGARKAATKTASKKSAARKGATKKRR